MLEIGMKIKELRVAEKMTQKDLAEIVHVTPQTISKWELNKSYPDLEILIQLNQFYNVSTDELLGNTMASFFISFFSKKRRDRSMWFKMLRMIYPIIFQFELDNALNV